MDENLFGKLLIFCSVVIIIYFMVGITWMVYTMRREDYPNNNLKIDKDYLKLMKKENKTFKHYIYSYDNWKTYCNNRLYEIEHMYYDEPVLEHKLNVVFVDFRKDLHFEYIIKNALIKLKGQCMITFVCGPSNYQYIKNLCKDISENIYVNYIDKNINSVKQYNKLCYDLNFWKNLKGEKILLHQFDAFIINSNINDFMDYDYVGGYWDKPQKGTHIGNGGFSLRTKNVIIKILETCKINHKIEEDIFFGSILNDNKKLGKLAPNHIAKEFAIDGNYSLNKFGCHKFWKDGIYFDDKIL